MKITFKCMSSRCKSVIVAEGAALAAARSLGVMMCPCGMPMGAKKVEHAKPAPAHRGGRGLDEFAPKKRKGKVKRGK